MYFAVVILLMGVLPIGSIVVDMAMHAGASPLVPIGKWFVFWAVGTRLLTAGLRQITKPAFTAEEIFGIKDPATHVIVQELGFANLSIGLLGVLSLIRPDWVAPAAIVGGLYLGLAGVIHLMRVHRDAKENVAMISDLGIFLVLAVYVAMTLTR